MVGVKDGAGVGVSVGIGVDVNSWYGAFCCC